MLYFSYNFLTLQNIDKIWKKNLYYSTKFDIKKIFKENIKK